MALKDGTDAPAFIPPAKYPALHRAALDACDAKDGVKDDAIEDPTRAIMIRHPFNAPDRTSLLSDSPTGGYCPAIYAGAKFADSTQIYSGFEPGSELLWNAMIAGPEPLFINNDFFK